MYVSKRLGRGKPIRKITLSLIVFILFAAGIVSFFYIPQFRIREITLKGFTSLNQEDLNAEILQVLDKKYFYILPYDNIFLLPKEEISARLQSRFSRVKNVALSRDFPQGITVEIRERKLQGLWCPALEDGSLAPANDPQESPQLCFYIDEDGIIFEKAPIFSGAIFLKFLDERGNALRLGEPILPIDEFRKLIQFHQLLNQNLNISITEVILKKDGIYELYTNDHWYIILNEQNDAKITAENLSLALGFQIKKRASSLKYIDLRFGNKIFYKFR